MRLIDADKLYPDKMTVEGSVAISQGQIAHAKTVPAIPIPKDATNGDIVKAIFPDVEFNRGEEGISTLFMKMDNDAGYASLYERWWNAPYKKESENK